MEDLNILNITGDPATELMKEMDVWDMPALYEIKLKEIRQADYAEGYKGLLEKVMCIVEFVQSLPKEYTNSKLILIPSDGTEVWLQHELTRIGMAVLVADI